jgi:hypothetical protein
MMQSRSYTFFAFVLRHFSHKRRLHVGMREDVIYFLPIEKEHD